MNFKLFDDKKVMNFFGENNNSYFTIKPDHKKLAAICHYQGLISFSNINDSKLEEYKLLFYYSGKYEDFGDYVASTRDSRWGFSNLVSDDSFIYSIYSDKTFLKDKYDVDDCNYLLVYDWEGNPIKKYKLDKTLVNLEIDEETKMLYGGGKDYTLVEYKVPTKEELLSKK